MNTRDILYTRLSNHGLLGEQLSTVEDVVSRLGAVQAQDYPSAKWALYQRVKKIEDTNIEDAFNKGKILRTHVLRPTWHFVTPKDIGWILTLTAPRVQAFNRYYYHQYALTEDVLKKSTLLLVKALQGKTYLTRIQLSSYLEKNGVKNEGLRMGLILLFAELEGVICSGPRIGKQFTYALLNERIPHVPVVSFDTALAELAKRYFTSHGPAQIKDFSWWSSLTVEQVKRGLLFNKDNLTNEVIDGKTYWFSKSQSRLVKDLPCAFLLPNYDEYTISYKDRSDFLKNDYSKTLTLKRNLIFNHSIILNGQIIGGWKRAIQKNILVFTYHFFTPVTSAEKAMVIAKIKKYGEFLNTSDILLKEVAS